MSTTTPNEQQFGRSRTIRHQAQNGFSQVYCPEQWIYLTASLTSGSAGANHLIIGKGTKGWAFTAGDILHQVLVAPGSSIGVWTDQSDSVYWSFVVTPLDLEPLMRDIRKALGGIEEATAASLQASSKLLEVMAAALVQNGHRRMPPEVTQEPPEAVPPRPSLRAFATDR